MDLRLLERQLSAALKKGEKRRVELAVSSTDRAVGTILGSDITRLHGNRLDDDTFTIKCSGGGGQSFGALLPKGLTLELEGDANDYFGKGLSGGRLVVYPPKESAFQPEENIIGGQRGPLRGHLRQGVHQRRGRGTRSASRNQVPRRW